eukprot:7391555-Prymnesium_polylepis.2
MLALIRALLVANGDQLANGLPGHASPDITHAGQPYPTAADASKPRNPLPYHLRCGTTRDAGKSTEKGCARSRTHAPESEEVLIEHSEAPWGSQAGLIQVQSPRFRKEIRRLVIVTPAKEVVHERWVLGQVVRLHLLEGEPPRRQRLRRCIRRVQVEDQPAARVMNHAGRRLRRERSHHFSRRLVRRHEATQRGWHRG